MTYKEEVRIATPDLQFLLDLYQHPEKEINQQYIDWAADQGHLPHRAVYVISRFHTAWGHQIIYDAQTLANLLESCGFHDLIRCEMSQSPHPELRDIESHFTTMPHAFCRLETMVVEGRR